MADLARIKRNVAKMASMNAPEEDIDGYIASEGVTVDDVRNYRELQPMTDEQRAQIQANKDEYNRKQAERNKDQWFVSLVENKPEGVIQNITRPVARLGLSAMQGIANAGLNPFTGVAEEMGADLKPIKPENAAERVAELAGEYGYNAAALYTLGKGIAGAYPSLSPYTAPLTFGGIPLAMSQSLGSALATGIVNPQSIIGRFATDILGGGLGTGLTRPKFTAPKQDVKTVKELTKSIGEDALNRDIAEAERTGRNLLEVGGDEVMQAAQQARQQSPEARKIITDTLESSIAGQPTRTRGAINEALGTKGKNATISQVMENAKAEAQPIYKELENIGDLAKFERNKNIENMLLTNEVKENITNQGEKNVLRQLSNNGQSAQLSRISVPSTAGEAEKSSSLRELVGKGYTYGGTSQNGLFIRRNDGTGIFSVNPEYSDLFDKAGVSKISYRQLKNTPEEAKQFYDAITNAKQTLGSVGEQVWTYTPEEYQNMKLFLSEDGLSGVAVKPDGDVVSVFNSAKKSMEDVGSRAHSLVELAKQNGGTKLDAFDTFLPKLYSKHGFKETSRDVWNQEFAPEKWDKSYFQKWNKGEPDVVYMQLQQPEPSQIQQLVKENQVLSDTISRVKRANSSLKNLPDTDFRVVNEARKALSQASMNRTELSGYEARQALNELDPILNNITGGKLAQANKLYSDAYQFERAADLGRDVFNSRKSPDDLKTAWNSLSSTEKQAAKIGLREEVMNKIGSATNETNALNRFLPENVREKITTIAGNKEGGRIIDEAEQAVKLRRNYNKLTSGSQTPEKQSLRDALRGIRGFVRNPWETTVDALAKPFDTRRNIRMAEYLTNPRIADAYKSVKLNQAINTSMPKTNYAPIKMRAILERINEENN